MKKKLLVISLFSMLVVGCTNQVVQQADNTKTAEEISRERLVNLAIEKNKEKEELERLKGLNEKQVYAELVKIDKELKNKKLTPQEKEELQRKVRILEQNMEANKK